MSKSVDLLEKALSVSTWDTPATHYPLNTVGSASIRRSKYRRGYYNMEGVDGYLFFKVEKPIDVTTLFIGKEQWMVDDPLHWIGMQRLAEHSKGRVLTAGLGLGLLVHALVKNPMVTYIGVSEHNKDVIDLVKPFIPKTPEIQVRNEDVFSLARTAKYFDTLILDIWTGRSNPHMFYEMIGAISFFKKYNPKLKIMVWGMSNHEINPAVNRGAEREVKDLHTAQIGMR
jgi:hypothetical protein